MVRFRAFVAGLCAASLAGAGPAEAQSAGVQVAAGVPDGKYSCHKLSPSGGLRQIGDMEVRRGRARLPGLPDGWTATGVFVAGKTERDQVLVAFEYRSAAGISDRLDCEPQ